MKRREALTKGMASVGAISLARLARDRSPTDPDEVILRAADVPADYEQVAYDLQQSSYLGLAPPGLLDSISLDCAGSCFLWQQDGHEVGSITSTAVVFDPPKRMTESLPFAYGRGAGDPPFTWGDAPLRPMRTGDVTGFLSPHILPDPSWEFDGPYLDVTYLGVAGDTVVGTVVYGPVTAGNDPVQLAGDLNAVMRTRVHHSNE